MPRVLETFAQEGMFDVPLNQATARYSCRLGSYQLHQCRRDRWFDTMGGENCGSGCFEGFRVLERGRQTLQEFRRIGVGGWMSGHVLGVGIERQGPAMG